LYCIAADQAEAPTKENDEVEAGEQGSKLRQSA
jgi:hypothetical protein